LISRSGDALPKISEYAIEDLCIQRLQARGYDYAYGPDIAPDGETPRRASFSDVLLLDELRAAIDRPIPDPPRTSCQIGWPASFTQLPFRSSGVVGEPFANTRNVPSPIGKGGGKGRGVLYGLVGALFPSAQPTLGYAPFFFCLCKGRETS
jgi:hypothetical protein